MSRGLRTLVLVILIALILGGLLFTTDEMPAEVDELSSIEFVLGLLALFSVFWLPVMGSLGLIALANKVLQR